MGKIFKLLVGVVCLAMVVAVASIWYASQQLQPVSATSQPKTNFVIPKGQGSSQIAIRLAEASLIRHPLAFRYELKRSGLENKIQAGSFELSPSMTLNEIAQTLTTGTNDLWVTVLEGWRREEIADMLDEEELSEFDKAEFLELSAASEGTLFPDTYLVPRQANANFMYTLFTNTFETKVTDGLADEIAASEREWDQVLVMASIVEREGRGYEQMREIAGILWNRFDINMPLQADATLQYIKGYDKASKNWWTTPLSEDKKLESAFNTYLNPGLPPRPIANPGLDAIKATLNPLKTDNTFYIHDQQGNIHAAETYEEHLRNVERYLRS